MHAIQVIRSDALDIKHFCWVSLLVAGRFFLVERGMQGVGERPATLLPTFPKTYNVVQGRRSRGPMTELKSFVFPFLSLSLGSSVFYINESTFATAIALQ